MMADLGQIDEISPSLGGEYPTSQHVFINSRFGLDNKTSSEGEEIPWRE
jgi:hypothetical protein